MRAVLVTMLVLFASPAFAEDWQGDDYLACMMGKGAVAMRHGETPKRALEAARKSCDKLTKEHGGDYVDYVIDATARSLQAIEATHEVF